MQEPERLHEILEVHPSQCRLWPGNPRPPGALTPKTCAALIDAIRAEEIQLVPAIVRRLPVPEVGPATGPILYEIVSGARRHCAVSFLNRNRLRIPFRITPLDLTDIEAFRIADAENRNRRDIAERDRALAYLHALHTHYMGNPRPLARDLGLKYPSLCRLLSLARLPEEVVAAYPDPARIGTRAAATLGPLLNHPQAREAVLAQARILAARPRTHPRFGLPKIPAAHITAILVAAGAPARPAKPVAEHTLYRAGRILAHASQAAAGTSRRLVITLPDPLSTPRADLMAALSDLLDTMLGRPARSLPHRNIMSR